MQNAIENHTRLIFNFENKTTNMDKKDCKILDELRQYGKIYEDPCPKSESFIDKLINIFLKKKKTFV